MLTIFFLSVILFIFIPLFVMDSEESSTEENKEEESEPEAGDDD